MKRKKNPTSLLLFLLSFLGGILLSSSLPVQSTLLTPSPSPSSSSSPAFSDAAVIPEEVFFQNPTLDEDLAKAYSEAGDLELDLDTIRLLQQDKEWSERTGLDEASTIVESPEELRIARAGYDDATALVRGNTPPFPRFLCWVAVVDLSPSVDALVWRIALLTGFLMLGIDL